MGEETVYSTRKQSARLYEDQLMYAVLPFRPPSMSLAAPFKVRQLLFLVALCIRVLEQVCKS